LGQPASPATSEPPRPSATLSGPWATATMLFTGAVRSCVPLLDGGNILDERSAVPCTGPPARRSQARHVTSVASAVCASAGRLAATTTEAGGRRWTMTEALDSRPVFIRIRPARQRGHPGSGRSGDADRPTGASNEPRDARALTYTRQLGSAGLWNGRAAGTDRHERYQRACGTGHRGR